MEIGETRRVRVGGQACGRTWQVTMAGVGLYELRPSRGKAANDGAAERSVLRALEAPQIRVSITALRAMAVSGVVHVTAHGARVKVSADVLRAALRYRGIVSAGVSHGYGDRWDAGAVVLHLSDGAVVLAVEYAGDATCDVRLEDAALRRKR